MIRAFGRVWLGLLLGCVAATGATAQEFFDGDWAFEPAATGTPLIVLTLDETDGAVSGTGEMLTASGGIGPGAITVMAGGAFEANMQIDLQLTPTDPAQQPTTMRLMVFEGTGTLLINGVSEPGFLVETVISRQGADDPIATAPPVALLSDPATACDDMQAYAAQLLMVNETGVAERVSGVVLSVQAQFPGTDSPERCQALLAGLVEIGADYGVLPAGGIPVAPEPEAPALDPTPEPVAAQGIACARIEELAVVYRDTGETNLAFFLDAVITANAEVGDAAERELNCEAVLSGLTQPAAANDDVPLEEANEPTGPQDSFTEGPASTGEIETVSPGTQQTPAPVTGPDSSGALLSPAFE